MSSRYRWLYWSDERLLQTPLCELDLSLEGSWVEPRVDQLYQELEWHGLRFRPHVWISDEWFCPDGVPGIAIPFYLFHPRLARLERMYLGEAEGYGEQACMRLLRHETGHALDNAYRLRQDPSRIRVFGPPQKRYPSTYHPRPYSQEFVKNLPQNYAQSHPDEDFAETFAVWLDPTSKWMQRYANWPALKKLLLMEKLMRSLKSQPPQVVNHYTPDEITGLNQTLGQYLRNKRRRVQQLQSGGSGPSYYL